MPRPDIESVIEWASALVDSDRKIPTIELALGYHRYDFEKSANWIAEAESALSSVFPAGHSTMTQWRRHIEEAQPKLLGTAAGHTFEALQGVLRSALSQLKAGRLSSVLEGVQAETVSEILDQADILAAKKFRVAAVVLAGGALETHLLHLCGRHSIAWSGDGSISAYNDAIARERKQGNEVYSVTDVKLVTYWGGMRNDAAHKPTEFDPKADVKGMINGIREFVARNP